MRLATTAGPAALMASTPLELQAVTVEFRVLSRVGGITMDEPQEPPGNDQQVAR